MTYDRRTGLFTDDLWWASTTPPTVQQPPEVMTLSEVAEYLRVSKSKVYEMCKTGEMPCLRIGNRQRVLRSALKDWVERNTSIA